MKYELHTCQFPSYHRDVAKAYALKLSLKLQEHIYILPFYGQYIVATAKDAHEVWHSDHYVYCTDEDVSFVNTG